jgi:bacterioferritin
VRGDTQILDLLNDQLTSELTAINQYFLHAKMQEHWGYQELAAYTRKESIEEMVHAERLTDRILFLSGLPNYQRLGTLKIGQTVREQFQADLEIEQSVLERLAPGIQMCRAKGDATTANLLEDIYANEEEHIDYLETQLALLDTLGEPLYLAQLLGQHGGAN